MSASPVHLQASHEGRHYDLTVQAVDGGHQVELIGSDADGQVLTVWRGTLPAAADLSTIGQLLARGAAALTGVPVPRPAAPLAEQRVRHANAARPWTGEDDTRLAELAAAPTATLEDLMRELGRSRGAVRSRLAKKVPHSVLLGRAHQVTP
jgi:hypothetical protein